MNYHDTDFETPEDIKEGILLEEDIETGTMYDGAECPVIVALDGTYFKDKKLDSIDISINFREV